jgi:membrane protease YdiL (CAAX protease family)
MNETLRPSTLGEILDRTFQIYRYNFWLFLGIAALPLVMAFVLAIPAVLIFSIPGIASGSVDPNAMVASVAFTLAFFIFLPLYLALYAFSIAGITQATVAMQRGEKLTIRTALKSVWPRFWTYFWYLLLQGIMAVLVPMCVAGVLMGLLIYLTSHAGGGLASGIAFGFLMFVVEAMAFGVIVWLALSYAMGMAVCVVEKKTAWQSLMRSWSLSKGTRGRIFVLYLLLVALSFVVLMISYFLAFAVIAAAAFLGTGKTIAAIAAIVAVIVYLVGIFGAQIALVPVPWIALVLFYYDQRIRKEGYDIEWMMQQAGLAQPPSAASPAGGTAAFNPATPPDTVPPDTVNE